MPETTGVALNALAGRVPFIEDKEISNGRGDRSQAARKTDIPSDSFYFSRVVCSHFGAWGRPLLSYHSEPLGLHCPKPMDGSTGNRRLFSS